MLIKKNKILNKYFKKNNKLIIFHIFNTFNNTIITLTNIKGDSIFWSTSSSIGYKGHKKSTFYAAQAVGEKVGRMAISLGYRISKIFIKGFGIGRDYAIRGIFGTGINVLSVIDVTAIPHNGCRFKKIKRN